MDNSFPKWHAEMRERAGLSQNKLSQKMGFSQAAVSRVEAGLIEPTAKYLRAFSAATGVTIGEALRHAGIDPDIDPNSAKEKEVLRIMQNASPQAVDDILEFARHRFALAKKRGESHASKKQNP